MQKVKEGCIMRTFITCMIQKIYSDQIEEDKMGRACSRHKR